MNAMKTARTLGVISLGLGLAGLVAPRAINRTLGTSVGSGVLRGLFGAREMAVGTAILASKRNPAPFLWSRVVGDVFDLASLGAALRRSPKKGNVAAALAAVAGITALDFSAARRLTPG